ncbi:MMPL family transporter [Nocardioides caldifontis]|uniref:MMPL family transporter n=1 Tax=Nocardioides caldifontis TaxID=2588938 RepID=UPI0011DF0E75|nr:MMPL family transporter [Nocardioides caldifontis]
MSTVLDALLRRRRAWVVALVGLLLGGVAIGVLGEAERDASPTDQLPRGLDSTEVVELQERFASEDASTAIALFTSDEQIPRDVLGELQQLFQEVAAPGQNQQQGQQRGQQQGREGQQRQGQGPTGQLVPSEDGTALIGVLTVPGTGASEVADGVGELRDRLDEAVPDGITAQLTGPAAVQTDLAAVFDGANFRLLAATASVVAVLLIVTYRSPVLWLVPLFVVGVADRAAASVATHVLKAFEVAWDESTVGILSVLVFGAGTDYALLLISRYRDELKVEEDRYAAMRHALRRTAESVVASATTVFVGLLTLMLSLIPTTRGLGLACAVGILVAAFAALCVLPFVLVLFGRWVFWPKVPRVGDPTLVESGSLWRRVGNQVRRRPGLLATGTVLLVALLAAGLTQVSTGLSQADQFLDEPEAISAAERLAESFPAGTADPTTVITSSDPGEVVAALEGVDGVERVTPTDSTDGLTRIDVVVAGTPGSEAVRTTIEAMRDATAELERTYVGGTEAESIDENDATGRDRTLIIPVVLLLVVVALVLLLRSLVAPLILVATVVGTYFAALGASWWVFTGPLGFEDLDSGVPLLAFLFLVALGVDYNIFLVTRAAEEAREHGTEEGMLRALTATGGVITSAGILLAAVFAVLGVLPLVVLAQLGVVICIGVLLDTLLVRTVLVPAVAVKLGDRFWWPRTLPRHAAASEERREEALTS